MGATMPVAQDGESMVVKSCDSDPRGTRFIEDALDCEECPIKTFVQKEDHWNVFRKQVEKNFQKCGKFCSEYEDVGTVLAEYPPGTFQEQRKELKKILENDEDSKLIFLKFNRLVEIYKATGSVPLVKKLAAVKRSDQYNQGDDYNDYKTPWYLRAYTIAFPMMLFFVCFCIQSVFLHLTTMLYVRYMFKGSADRREQGGELFDIVGHYVGSTFGNHTGNEGAVVEGHVQIPLKLLDASAGFPLLVCVGTFAWSFFKSPKPFNIGLWNTAFIVASIMAVLKGVTDVMTIMPDSMGWDVCKERLGEDGLQKMNLGHWLNNWSETIGSLLRAEVFGGSSGRRIRYCADMMLSGHTYFTVIFSLTAYRNMEYISGGKSVWLRRFIGLLCLSAVAGEVTLVGLARFHYTADMFLSVVLVLLFFDSTHIQQLAADWSEGYEWSDPSFVPESSFCYACIFRCVRRRAISKREKELSKVEPSQGYMVNLRRVTKYEPWSIRRHLFCCQPLEPAE